MPKLPCETEQYKLVDQKCKLTLVIKMTEVVTTMSIDNDLDGPRGFTAHLPEYGQVRALLPVIVGTKKDELSSLISVVFSITGTPQQTLDWSEPDQWIPSRLSGSARDLASRIWNDTNNVVNPRYLRGHYYFILRHQLLSTDAENRFITTSKSERFSDDDECLIRELDQTEGNAFLLHTIDRLESVKAEELRSEWSTFVQTRSNYRADSSMRGLLRWRLRNLESRNLISRDRGRISLTSTGKVYVQETIPPETPEETEYDQLMEQIRGYNRLQREQLRTLLTSMDPYAFEYLVRDLLEEMGYADVNVTAQGGDHGIDVVASVEFGITTITEVVQVKRRTKTLGRNVLDQLRGALPYHSALRGTLITLGSFSSGCRDAAIFPGAQPITLIDGERLLDLLVKHQVAIKSRQIALQEVDESYFTLAREEGYADEDP
jgi:restriction system protein